jgi:hypothetical protein
MPSVTTTSPSAEFSVKITLQNLSTSPNIRLAAISFGGFVAAQALLFPARNGGALLRERLQGAVLLASYPA